METHTSAALIIGVTGMVGLSLAEALKKPTALGGPWTVYGVARRKMPPWFNPSLVDRYIECDVLDFNATQQQLSPISSQVTHIFWLSLNSSSTSEEENIARNSAMIKNVLDVLVSTALRSKVRHFTLTTGTKQYLGPIFDPVLSKQVIPHEPPFHEHMQRLPFINIYYALEDLLASYSSNFSSSIHRSSIILGASARSGHNALLTVIVYALICRYEGSPFRFPGNKFIWESFFDASDSELLAEQQIWAVNSDKAKNQAFNCTNGDVFTWKNLWKLLCEIFGIEFVPFDETDKFNWVEEMKSKGKIWDTIVEENSLLKLRFEEVACFEACNIVLNMHIQHVCSMTKSREFGFYGFADTFKSVRKWVERSKEMNIIPKH
ncbi:Delta-4,5-steroid 5-beta-reductase [Thalictrum thalictroides]|uniref:Delta-4,5-steroid 5-beta-reductase n=1 Tax=Thalictrum thalictroides TaxID=46969 RepID=A0A7J6XB08_THATH|nr:Delta-4,5-steroid 5-beta-reductase [Thalictrum thalictroides]KAF5206981.1 Delta-4,5-steroid 5-beta-reductase [Thalictrum thalictroides]